MNNIKENLMYAEEGYDPKANVCTDQDTFNQALRKAVRHNEKEDIKKAGAWVYVYLVLWVIFFVWALTLAMKVPPGPEKVEHLVFAMVFSPIYVLSHYIANMKN